MNLEIEYGVDILLVRVLEHRIDASVAIAFKDRLRDAFACPAPRVVLDLSQVEFLDSSGLGAVVAARKLLAPDRRPELAGLTPMVAKVFRLTRMDSIFTIHADADSARGLQNAG